MVETLSDKNFDEFIKSNEVVMADFWAPWCRPCHVLSTVVDKVSEEVGGGSKVGKLNIDENPATTAKYRVNAIPTLLFFKGGKEVKRLVGLQEAQVLVESLQNLK